MWILVTTLALWTQDPPALAKAQNARARAETAFGELEGVRVVGLGGSGTEYRLIVSCLDAALQAEAKTLAGGDAIDGVRILWTVGPALKPAAAKAAPPPPPAPEELLRGEATDCDIIRDYLKMKAVHHPIGNGRSFIPCQLVRRSVVGPGGGHTYVYTKHRGNCPIRLGRTSKPPWADNFVAWVFQKGFTPVLRAGFTWPYELRADDKLWDTQAKNELMTRLPQIREGAEWTYTNSQYEKVTTPGYSGWFSTGGWPGKGWTWRDPLTSQNAGTPRPEPVLPANPWIPAAGNAPPPGYVLVPLPPPPPKDQKN